MPRNIHLLLLAFLLLALPAGAQRSVLKDSPSVIRLKADQARSLGMDSLKEYQDMVRDLSETLLMEAFHKEGALDLQGKSSSRTLVRLNRMTLPLSASASASLLSGAVSRMSQLRDFALSHGAWPEAQEGMTEEKDVWKDVLELTEEESALLSAQTNDTFLVVASPVGVHLLQILEGPLDVDQKAAGHLTDAAVLDSWARSLEGYRQVRINEAAVSHLRQGSATDREILLSLGDHDYTVAQFQIFQQSNPLSLQRQVDRFAALCVAREETSRLLPQDSLDYLLENRQNEWLAARLTEERVVKAAERDSAGLESYFLSHLDDYAYPKGAYRGVVVHASSKKEIKNIKKLLKKLPEAEWSEALRLVFGDSGQVIRYDSGLFFPSDNAFVDNEAFSGPKPRPFPDHPLTLVMGRKIRHPESLDSIREDVLEDYMADLNGKWVRQLEHR